METQTANSSLCFCREVTLADIPLVSPVGLDSLPIDTSQVALRMLDYLKSISGRNPDYPWIPVEMIEDDPGVQAVLDLFLAGKLRAVSAFNLDTKQTTFLVSPK